MVLRSLPRCRVIAQVVQPWRRSACTSISSSRVSMNGWGPLELVSAQMPPFSKGLRALTEPPGWGVSVNRCGEFQLSVISAPQPRTPAQTSSTSLAWALSLTPTDLPDSSRLPRTTSASSPCSSPRPKTASAHSVANPPSEPSRPEACRPNTTPASTTTSTRRTHGPEPSGQPETRRDQATSTNTTATSTAAAPTTGSPADASTRASGRRPRKSASQSVQEVATPLGVVRPSRTATQFELADQQIAVARPARQELGQSSVADRGRDVGSEQMCARERNVDAFGDKDLVACGCFVKATVGVSRLGVPVQDQCKV